MSHTALIECSMTMPPMVFASPMHPWNTIADRPK